MGARITVEDHIATIVLDRPQAMNATDPEMRDELYAIADRIRKDEDIWVAILTGAGDRAFCTGADLKKTMPTSDSFAAQIFAQNIIALGASFETDKPLIAAVNGFAMGGGMELALACDIRVASENAQFALSEVRVGSIPGSAGTQRLPRAINSSDAMLMLLTGDRFSAAEALRMGLVSKVVPHAELITTAMEIARKIASNAPLSVRAVKRLAKRGLDMPLAHAMETERYVFGLLYQSEDRIEGRKAFAEKRKPHYKGR
jgi:E-phenylitaconyl-CoA hydratase